MGFNRSQGPTRLNGVQINQSVLGYALPLVMGRGKVQQSILWVDGFSGKKAPSGGKGFGGGKGSGGYLYSADVIAALCNGPVLGVGDVWSGQSWLSNTAATESYTIGSPYTYTPANAGQYALDRGVYRGVAYSGTYNDIGQTVSLSGTHQTPFQNVPHGTTLSSGQYSVDPTGKYYFAAADNGRAVTISYDFSLGKIKEQINSMIPSGRTVTVGGSLPFLGDAGVTYYTGPNDGTALVKVGSSPGTGQYSVSGRTYTFAAGDVGKEVRITYKLDNSANIPKGVPSSLDFLLYNGALGQSRWSLLTTNFPGAALGYSGIAYAAYGPMDLGSGAQVQQNVFEVFTSDAWGGGVLDCNPVRCMRQVLTNPVWGLGAGMVPFPASVIDSVTWGTGTMAGTPVADSTASSWFAANSFFISPVVDHQDSAASLMSKWLEAGACSAFYSEGLLKLVPYGDTSAAANGCTWIAPSAFACALDDTCFLNKDNEDPVKTSSTPYTDGYSTVQIGWTNRANQYSPDVTPETDQAAANRYGSRIEDPQTYEFIHTLAAATFAGNMRVKRLVYNRNQYEFSLPYRYTYLEPMDVVEITTSSVWAAGLNNANLGMVNLPVRIVKVDDNPDGTLDVVAEDYLGVNCPVIYNKDMAAGEVQVNEFADPGDTTAVVWEPTPRLSKYRSHEIWIGAAGESRDWGGCNVFASSDGSTYKQIGTIDTPARLGTMLTVPSVSADPDTSDSFSVQLVTGSEPLESATTADADANNTLCLIGGQELVSYSTCTATGPDQYTATGYMRRGQMDSLRTVHYAGDRFLRVDESVLQYSYDPAWVGKTIYLKFQSFNTYGHSAQDLSTVSPVTLAVGGVSGGVIDILVGKIHSPKVLYNDGNTAEDLKPAQAGADVTASNTAGDVLTGAGKAVAESGANVTSAHILTASASPSAGYFTALPNGSYGSITGLGFSVTSAGASDVFNLFGMLDITINSAQAYIALYVDGVIQSGATRTFTKDGEVPYFASLTGLSAGAHTLQFYGKGSGTADYVHQASYVICQRIF